MASYTPCAGSGQAAVKLEHYPSQPDGLGMTRAKTFGECPACGRTVKSYGIAAYIKVNRHKAQEVTGAAEDVALAGPYAVDPLHPTAAEIDAAIQRSLAVGTLIDADDWMARHAQYA